jgi:hypothetical protein
MRLSEEPPHPPLRADVARALIAAVRRLAHAELAQHALVVARGSNGQPTEIVSARLDALAAAVDATLRALTRSLMVVSAPAPNLALRALQTAVRDTPAIDAGLVDITDGLVDATNTLDAIVRRAFVAGASEPSRPAAGTGSSPSTR